jgi:hypothetical protein
MKKIISILFLFAALNTHAQTWDSLSYNPNQSGLELNPLKGFATMFNPSNTFPRSIQGRLFGLDEVMIGMNNFNWAVIDTFLAQQANAGRHSYVQVNIDPAFGQTDMPTFLKPQVDWEYYTGGAVADSCPDWNDAELMAAMLNFIDSFGARYNNDPRIFMVHLGLYGIWGEWHIGDVADIRPEFVITDNNKSLIANAYKNAFPNKHLLARYPENMPDPQAYGYSDGLFFGQSISPTNAYYFHNILKTSQADENWKLYPIGGEIDPGLQSTLFDVLPNTVGQNVFQCLDSIKPTWLFCHHLLTAAQPNTTEWDNGIQVQKAMGYTLHIDKFRLSAANGKPTVELNIQNKGIAPLYANWDVEYGVINAANQFISLGVKKCDLNIIQPNVIDNYRSFFSESILTDGLYTFIVRVVNPLEAYSANAKKLRFANNTQDQHLDGWLTLGQKNIVSGSLSNVPQKVTSISLTPATNTLIVGQSLQLIASISPLYATNAGVTYISDHPSTASVNNNGLVTTGPVFGNVVITAYTQDGGFIGICSLAVEPVRVPIPAILQAENYIRMKGIVAENCGEGGLNLGYIDNGDWMDYGVIVSTPANFSVDFRVASPSGGGELCLVDEGGDTLGTAIVPNTGGWQTYTTVTLNAIVLNAGAYNLRVFARKGGLNFNWIEFNSNGPLAANQIDIKALVNNNQIIIKWVANESFKNEIYCIQRSTDGNSFNTIGNMAAKDMASAHNDYTFIDAKVAKNTQYYYRVMVLDNDGKKTFSNTATAIINQHEMNTADLISLYPNPTSNKFTIVLNSHGTLLPKSIKLYNTLGNEVYTKILSAETIDISDLPNGIYFLSVQVNGQLIRKKVIKN